MSDIPSIPWILFRVSCAHPAEIPHAHTPHEYYCRIHCRIPASHTDRKYSLRFWSRSHSPFDLEQSHAITISSSERRPRAPPLMASSSASAAAARKSVKGSGFLGMMTGRRNRQETMLSIRKAKKEDAYATRRNLKANHPRAATAIQDTASRRELLQNLAQRSQALLLGACFVNVRGGELCVRLTLPTLSDRHPAQGRRHAPQIDAGVRVPAL